VKELKLHDGSRIAIIGGGPAGSFFAHFALKLARQKGIDVEITVLDGKNFLRQGPPGCNMCAGVISETLLARLEQEAILLPEERVQHRIDAYYMQTADAGLLLEHPQGKRGAIRTVFRGSGPRFSTEVGDVSFDDFLLGHVKSRGVQVVEQVVTEILLPGDPRDSVLLLCGSPGSRVEREADLVVCAFGLNTALLAKVEALGFGYRPPRFVRTVQAELDLGADHIRKHLGNRIYVFSLGLQDVRFAALTPKREHVTVSVIGFRDTTVSDLRAYLDQPAVRALLPAGDLLADGCCRCRPRIGLTPAKRPYTDRLVVVGDASCSRYFKNGIESAFVTAQLAAEAAFQAGVSAAALRKAYMGPVRRTLVRDNRYGRLLFKVHDVASRCSILTQSYHKVAASTRARDPVARLARRILWEMFTGNVPYRTIFCQGFDPRLQARLTGATLGLLAQSRRTHARDRAQARPDETREPAP
jgi:flavin-dependent dehydrogenase